MRAPEWTATGLPTVSEGNVLAGKYKVERVIGTGGMGVVVAARHIDLDSRVALKFMLPDSLDDPEAVARFLRAARATARLRGPHIARVTDVGSLDNGVPYLVMEYLEGTDLGQLVRKGQTIRIEQSVEFVVQACEAVEEAHTNQIIHRDIKPSNLFVTRLANGAEYIKVLDFGISKFTPVGAESSVHTRSQTVMGSPLYMAPEQMRSSRLADARSDIWSLGATLYELLTGRPPFSGDSMMELCLKVAQDPPLTPRALRPNIPDNLESIVLRCLAKSPDDRFQSAAELRRALRPFAKRPSGFPPAGNQVHEGHSAAVAPSQPAPNASPETRSDSHRQTGGPNRRLSRLTTAAAASFCLAVAVTIAVLAIRLFRAMSSTASDSQPHATQVASAEATSSVSVSVSPTAMEPSTQPARTVQTPMAKPSHPWAKRPPPSSRPPTVRQPGLSNPDPYANPN